MTLITDGYSDIAPKVQNTCTWGIFWNEEEGGLWESAHVFELRRSEPQKTLLCWQHAGRTCLTTSLDSDVAELNRTESARSPPGCFHQLHRARDVVLFVQGSGQWVTAKELGVSIFTDVTTVCVSQSSDWWRSSFVSAAYCGWQRPRHTLLHITIVMKMFTSDSAHNTKTHGDAFLGNLFSSGLVCYQHALITCMCKSCV